MPDKVISIDEYLSDRKHCTTSDGVLLKAASAPRSFDADGRTCKFVMSSQELDRDYDVVMTKGIDTAHFENNPIALMNHRADHPIGKWSDLVKRSKALEGVVNLVDEGTADYVDMLAKMIGQGVVRAASIGFRVKTLKRRELEDGAYARGYIIEECDLIECSVVSVPANALALAKDAQDGNAVATEIIEYCLDNYTKNDAGLIVPIDELEEAHKQATGNKTTHQTVTLKLDAKDVEKMVDEAVKKAGLSLSSEDPDPKDEGKPAEKAEINEAKASVLDTLKELIGLSKAPEPPKTADPERVKALSARAEKIREAQKAA